MMKTSPILLLLILSFISAAISDPGHDDPIQLIDESCKLASTFDGRFTKEYCVSTLSSFPWDPKAKMSQVELAGIGLTLLQKNVTATKAKIDLIAHSGPGQTNPTLRNILKHCASMYNEAIHRVEKALKDMEEKNYSHADFTVSMVQGDGTECEEAFRVETNVVSPLTRENSDTENLGAMATLLIRFFDKSYTPWGVAIPKTT